MSVTKIGSEVFIDCGIQSINMPEGLSTGFFLDLQYSNQLKTIFTNRRFTSHMGVVYSREMDTLYFCPRGIKADWSDLEIDLFDTKVIDVAAFRDCEKIAGKLFLNSELVIIGNGAFEHCTGITGEIEIPYSVRKIGNRAFAGCTNLEGVIIPKVKLFDDLTSDGCSYEFDAFDDQLYDKLKIGQRVDHGIPDKKVYPETIENNTTPEVSVALPAYWDYTVKSLIYFEPFYQRSNWYEGDLDKCKKYYQNCSAGYYELSSKCDGSYCTINYNTGSGFIIDQDKDFSIEADIMFVFGRDNGSNKLVWGQDEKFNRFLYGFSGNGQFTIGKFQDDKYIVIKPWTVSPLIKKDGFNALTVRKIGDQFYFYLNTELVYNCPFQPFYGQELAFQGNENSTIRIKSLIIEYIKKK